MSSSNAFGEVEMRRKARIALACSICLVGSLVTGLRAADDALAQGLAVRALGPKRVFALFMPERDSDPLSLELATEWADKLGIDHVTEDIGDTLDAAGCYARRNDAIRTLVPEFRDDWRFKIVLPGARFESDRLNVFSLMSAAARLPYAVGPLQVTHPGQLPSVTLSFDVRPGVSLSQAIDQVQAAMRELQVPPTVSAMFSGTAQAYQA
jgi:hypothetical protein